MGGGFPAAAFGGRADIMDCLSPLGPVYQAGTLSGNPIAMTAGLATLDLLMASGADFYTHLAAKTKTLVDHLNQLAQKANVPFHALAIGSMFGMFFSDQSSFVTEADVKRCHLGLFKQFFRKMLQAGIYFAPSAYEIGFVSAAHGEREIQATLDAADQVFKEIAPIPV